MFEYRVQSGPLKITLVAETTYDAALEAVRWWGRRTGKKSGAEHRLSLDAELNVSGREGSHKVCQRFATFNVIAQANDENPENAWNQLLDKAIANLN